MSARGRGVVTRIYAALLRLLPGRFRSANAEEMELLFRERAEAARERGAPAVVRFLVSEVFDVTLTAWRLRRPAPDAAVREGRPESPRIALLMGDAAAGAGLVLRHPARSVMALVVIALGIGATGSVFAIVDAVALRPLPHAEPDRLVVVGQTVPSLGDTRVPMAWPNYVDLRSRDDTGMAEMAAFRWPSPLRVSVGAGGPEVHGVSAVGGGLFELLGNDAALGRVIDAADAGAEARVAVLGHALWRTRFGGDRSVIGTAITIEEQPYEIVGVMAESFSFPVPSADVYVPLRRIAPMEDRDTRFMGVVGRLQDGVSLEVARARMRSAMADLVREWPEANEGNGIRIDSLREVVVGDARPVMLMLLGASLLLLVLSCASVANLLLARVSSRSSELAMRRALGAGRSRLLAQLFGESLALAVAGGVLGLALAFVTVRLLAGLVPPALPRAATIGFDARTFVFAAGATLLSGVLFGVVPALRGSTSSPADPLRQASHGILGRSRNGLLRSLVAVQVAITVVLLVCGALLVNSFARLQSVDPGLDPAGVVTMRVNLPGAYDDPRRVDAFFAELIDRAGALPGVRAAGATWALPFTRDWASGRITVEGDPKPRGEELLPGMIPVRGDYFAAAGMRLVAGRLFDDADEARARAPLATRAGESPQDEPGLAVINESAARAMWPGEESVIGHRFRYGRADEVDMPWVTVIGVVRDAKRFDLGSATEAEIYQLHPQALWATGMSLVVRSNADPLGLVTPLRHVVADLDPSLAVTQVGLIEDFVHRSLAEPRFRTLVVLTFGTASLVLALAGIYGVLAFVVSLRTREIGLRMALGAGRARMLTDVLGEGTALVIAGIAFGLVGAAAGVGALRNQLFGIGPFDAATWLATVFVVSLTGAAASWLPARRASRVSPSIAMRE